MFWEKCMYFGKLIGCHQLPERSFKIKGKQFPICARCTGVLIGEIVAFVGFRVWKPSVCLTIFLCFLMFFDWFIQQIGIRESKNWRRILTGLFGGYGFVSLFLYFVVLMS